MATLPQAQPTFEPCPECIARLGTRDFKYCDACTALRDAWVEEQAAKCVPLCSNCEQRPPHDEGATLCTICRDVHDADDGAKRTRMTQDQREQATNDKLTHEVMPPLPPELQAPAAPTTPRRTARAKKTTRRAAR